MEISKTSGSAASSAADSSPVLSGGLDANGIPKGVPPPKDWGAYPVVANHMKALWTTKITASSLEHLGSDLPDYFRSSDYYRVDIGKIGGAQYFGYFNNEEISVQLIAKLGGAKPEWYIASR